MNRVPTVLAALAAALAPAAAHGHEVLHEIARGRAVAVRAYESDGGALGDARYDVYSPADRSVPYLSGRTDRGGWLAFVPDAPGTWRVKVVGDDGHGLDVGVDVPAAPAAIAVAGDGAPTSTAAFVLRPLAGVAAIAAVFGGLLALYRRKGNPR